MNNWTNCNQTLHKCYLGGPQHLIDFCFIWKFNVAARLNILSDWLKFKKIFYIKPYGKTIISLFLSLTTEPLVTLLAGLFLMFWQKRHIVWKIWYMVSNLIYMYHLSIMFYENISSGGNSSVLIWHYISDKISIYMYKFTIDRLKKKIRRYFFIDKSSSMPFSLDELVHMTLMLHIFL